MRKLFTLGAILLLSAIGLRAQVTVSSTLFDAVTFTLKAQVLDSLTNEPVAFASAYLRHPKDTVITNFAITDSLGSFEVGNVTRGEHMVCVEMLGYRPFYKKIYVRDDIDLKTILLQQDKEQLKAALVSAIGTPMEIRQDTVIYNASSFKTLSGDNLAALLKKMPGIEVGSDGSVTVNGKAVSRITVNGRTFFLGDQKAALDNLPARIVDKVKVIDKETDAAEFSGIKGDKVKVMDVELKEEYKKGWFGNVNLSGGTSLPGKNDNEFRESKDLLYNGSGMFSAYGEKNQLTAIASASNFADRNAFIVTSSGGLRAGVPTLDADGLHTNRNVGVNLNSQAVKNFNTDASVTFSSQTVDKHSRTDRTTFQSSGKDLDDTAERLINGKVSKLGVKGEIENTGKKNFTVKITPEFGFYGYTNTESSSTLAKQAGELLNSSESFVSTNKRGWYANADYTLGVRNIGKKGRSLTLSGLYSFASSDGDELESSETYYSASETSLKRNLLYDTDGTDRAFTAQLDWTEPIAKNWKALFSAGYNFTGRDSNRDAANSDGSANDYYSSFSDNDYTDYTGRILAQYSKGRTTLQAGGHVRVMNNETYSRSYNIDTHTGTGEWQTVISPYVRLSTQVMKQSLNAYINSSISRPSTLNLRPAFSIVNPTRITAGNIYLKPSYSYSANAYSYGSAGKSSLNLSFNSSLTSSPQVSAVWFDSDGIRYSIPVNSRQPRVSAGISVSGNSPLTSDGKFSLVYRLYSSLSQSTSYQSKGTMTGIDTDNFDYASFMQQFWGNASGDRFYSGESGFRTSKTRSGHTRTTLGAVARLGSLSINLADRATIETYRYSLDSKANTTAIINILEFNTVYTSDNGLECMSAFSYDVRRGYGAAYNVNDFIWDITVGKSIKSFTLSLKIYDLLNSQRVFNHTAYQEYIEDSFSNALGRTITLSFAWNFGKSNSAQAMKAQTQSLRLAM